MHSLIFLEGIPGSGKSTLLQFLSERFPSVPAYREGDLSPIELAWCSELSIPAYETLRSRYPALDAEIRAHSRQEGERMHVAYTQIRTDDPAFYAEWEQHEIYSGRRDPAEFRDILLRRYQTYAEEQRRAFTPAIFECSLFQNSIEEWMLHICPPEEEIFRFYREVFSRFAGVPLTLIRLIPQDMARSIDAICRERVNEQGEEIWYQMMMDYLNGSAYGRRHPFRTREDLLAHFRRRTDLERRIIADCFPGKYLELESRAYDPEAILAELQ